MELCYVGDLVMPSSYAMMDEEEMSYVEGGSWAENIACGLIMYAITRVADI